MIVSIIVTVLVLALGVWRRNQPGFWPRGIAAIVVAWALPIMFSGGGTLASPEGEVSSRISSGAPPMMVL